MDEDQHDYPPEGGVEDPSLVPEYRQAMSGFRKKITERHPGYRVSVKCPGCSGSVELGSEHAVVEALMAPDGKGAPEPGMVGLCSEACLQVVRRSGCFRWARSGN